MRVGPRHYLTGGLCAVIVALAVADLLLLNVNERREELAQLHACGWRPVHVAGLIVLEGVLLGLVGGLCGVLGGGVLMWAAFGGSATGLAIGALVLPLPVAAAMLGALLPALAALRGTVAGRTRGE